SAILTVTPPTLTPRSRMTYRTRSPYAACLSVGTSPDGTHAEGPTARMRSGLRDRSVVVTLVVVVVVVDAHEVGLLDDLGVVILAAEHRGREGRDVDRLALLVD